MRARRFLGLLQNDARVHDHRIIDGIDSLDLIHALQRQQDGLAVSRRSAAPHKTRVS